VLLVWDGFHDRLGVNPVEFITRTTGILTLSFLLLGLAVTPAKRFLGAALLPRVRRMLGLFAFFYGSLHFLTWLWLDKFFSLKGVVEDLTSRLFLIVGAVAFFAMVPLALTSTDAAIKRMGGERWKKLHQRVYFIAICGTIHYFIAVKADLTRPIVFAGVLAVLLAARLVRPRSRRRAASPTS
jgi:sulfoxide reductase heme-binding subunit YedZ